MGQTQVLRERVGIVGVCYKLLASAQKPLTFPAQHAAEDIGFCQERAWHELWAPWPVCLWQHNGEVSGNGVQSFKRLRKLKHLQDSCVGFWQGPATLFLIVCLLCLGARITIYFWPLLWFPRIWLEEEICGQGWGLEPSWLVCVFLLENKSPAGWNSPSWGFLFSCCSRSRNSAIPICSLLFAGVEFVPWGGRGERFSWQDMLFSALPQPECFLSCLLGSQSGELAGLSACKRFKEMCSLLSDCWQMDTLSSSVAWGSLI